MYIFVACSSLLKRDYFDDILTFYNSFLTVIHLFHKEHILNIQYLFTLTVQSSLAFQIN